MSGFIGRKQRMDDEGKMIVGVDAGREDTDPRYRSFQEQIAIGETWQWFDFVCAGKYLQAVRVQCQNAKPGDLMDLVVASDGSNPLYGPENTVLKQYGPINAPQPDGQNQWAREMVPIVSQTSAQVPAGCKIRVGYYATDAQSRWFLYDLAMQE